MKEYLKQFYDEGLARVLYKKPVAYLDKKIKNKKVVKFLATSIKILYTIIVLAFAGYYLYIKLK